jgi:hypothetical protein
MRKLALLLAIALVSGVAVAETDYIALGQINSITKGNTDLEDPDVSGTLNVDTIREYTSTNGVVIDFVTMRDAQVTATNGVNTDTISEATAASGVTVDSVVLQDGGITATGAISTGGDVTGNDVTGTNSVITDTITELTAAAGVTVDSVELKDGGITCDTAIFTAATDTIAYHSYTVTVSSATMLLEAGAFAQASSTIANPAGAGQDLVLINVSTSKIGFADSGNLSLSGDLNLLQFDTIHLRASSVSNWCEVSNSNN